MGGDHDEENEVKRVSVRGITYMISYRALVLITELLVLFALVTCVVSALLFRFSDVIDRDCDDRTPNLLASISAVTGISPQRYIWRICIALHATPRVAMAVAYYNLYMASACRLFSQARVSGGTKKSEEDSSSNNKEDTNGDQSHKSESVRPTEETITELYKRLSAILWRLTSTHGFLKLIVRISVVLNLVELGCLLGISYISNQDNYPVHEKLFELFGLCHLFYTVSSVWINKRLHEPAAASSDRCLPWTDTQRFTYSVKCRLTVLAWLLMFVMAISFEAHTKHCVPYAFTVFAFAEYVATLSNMAFHFMAVYDLPGAVLVLGVPTDDSSRDADENANSAPQHNGSVKWAVNARNGRCVASVPPPHVKAS